MYSFRQILNVMAAGQVFTCKVVSYDRTRRTGGEVIELSGKLLKNEEVRGKAGRQLTRSEVQQAALMGLRRDPNHRTWYTRNIQLYADGIPTIVIKKIHIPLIVEFNGELVTP